jgi:hypothetical protein
MSDERDETPRIISDVETRKLCIPPGLIGEAGDGRCKLSVDVKVGTDGQKSSSGERRTDSRTTADCRTNQFHSCCDVNTEVYFLKSEL